MTVKSALYAKYYFEMRALFTNNEKEFPMTPIDKRDADRLELNSANHEEKLKKADVQQRISSTFGGIESKPMWWIIKWTHWNFSLVSTIKHYQ